MTASKTEARPSLAPQGPGKERVAPILLGIFLLGIYVVTLGGISGPQYRVIPVLLWSFGFSMTGLLLGFLFGIPRTMPAQASSGKEEQGQEKDSKNASKTAPEIFNEINSNLVEVSDWLTKIIVGVGLVESKDILRKTVEGARFIAPSFGLDKESGPAIVCGVMLFFTVLGFLSGYLLTRIYLAIIIKRADIEMKSQTVQLDSGKEIELGELARLQQTTLNDLQSTVARFVSSTPEAVAAMAPDAEEGSTAGAVDRILWVDDYPDNNTLLVEQLERDGAVVHQSLSTAQAIVALGKNNYDAVISDMGRNEDGAYVPDAGIKLTKAIQDSGRQIPVFIYCSKGGVLHYTPQAKLAGAKLITSSGVKLIATLKSVLRKTPGMEPAL